MDALIFDTETHKLHGDIIEAGALDIRFENDVLVMGYEHHLGRFKPSEPISLAAMAIHHIIDDDLINCESYTTFKIPKKLNTRYLIGHNIQYDIDAMNRTGFDFNAQLLRPFEPICTLAMARRLWPTLESHTLTALSYHVSENRGQTRVYLKESHSAINDCYSTFELLKAIVKEAGIKDMDGLAAFAYSSRIPTHIFYGNYKGIAIRDLSTDSLFFIKARNNDSYLETAIENELNYRHQSLEQDFENDDGYIRSEDKI